MLRPYLLVFYIYCTSFHSICLQLEASGSVLKEQLDAAIELYQAEMRLRLEAEERIAKLEATIALQAKEVSAHAYHSCVTLLFTY